MVLEDNLKYSLLFELYKNLLTTKQQNLLKDFLDNNLALSELANIYSCSRQAVNDLIKRTIKILDNYESKLHLLQKFNKIKDEICSLTLLCDKDDDFEKQIKQRLNKIMEVL